ncbi:LysR family transcriptional regulator [Chitinibacter bivalviorum]|uniref:LysR family transcriptional regulator n=1 Tax=Chitinibacter bivalviorum TaxID=2739434 RepID=A0A7H9BJ59_9NEIS|nr:LysR family transcriptional regulator [Chitinibacter bivalviorum]QLG88031.1 LysR family transcriptional regulator [Chitinibacter bivalviorum]
MLDDLALFVCIVEAGSLSAAAKKMDLPAATLTRRLQKLEQQLGCQLLHRSARRMLPTPAGQQYYEQCRPLLQALQQTTQSLDANLNQLSGTVRVLAPINLSNGPFRHFWSSFMLRYPEIKLELQLSNHKEDLLGNGADLAIRVGEQSDSSFGQRRLGEVRIVLTASPDYLAKNPPIVNPSSLAQHKLIVADPVTQWRFTERSTSIPQTWLPQGHFRVNEIQLAVHMARSGIGLLYCPKPQVIQELESGQLVTVMPDWETESRVIYAVWPQSQLMPARVRVLLDHLVDCAMAHPLFN